VINIFPPCAAGKTVLVDAVVLGGLLMECRGLVVGILGKLKLSALGEAAKGRSHTFPIDIFKSSCIPILLKEGIMPF
jgi:hypothetical protein